MTIYVCLGNRFVRASTQGSMVGHAKMCVCPIVDTLSLCVCVLE